MTTKTVAQATANGSVAVGGGYVWASFDTGAVVRLDASGTHAVDGIAGDGAGAVAYGDGAVWVANAGDNDVGRLVPATVTTFATPTVGRRPSGIAVGGGAVWVADEGDDTVTRIDLASGSASTIPVGRGPTGIAVGAGAVWVADSDDATVTRIDLDGGRPPRTIVVGNRPTGVAVAYGRVWVTVQPTT